MTAVTEQPARLLKVTEVASRLSMSRSAVYGLMTRGELPFVKIGKSRRLRPEDVARLIDEGSTGEK